MATFFFNLYRYFSERQWTLQFTIFVITVICAISASHMNILNQDGTVSPNIFSANLELRPFAGTGAIIIVLVISAFLLFRRKRTALFVMVPTLFGIIFAFGVIAMIRQSVSSNVMHAMPFSTAVGIAWSLLIFGNFHRSQSINQTVRDTAPPLFICAAAGILPMLYLFLGQDRIMGDILLFLILSLTGIILFTVIASMQIIRATGYETAIRDYRVLSIIGKITSYPWKLNRVFIPLFIAATSIFTIRAYHYCASSGSFVIPAVTAAIILAILLAYYGRLELTIITAIPVAAAFFWTCAGLSYAGISVSEYTRSALVIIIPAGIGAAIFVMDGLILEYKTGKHVLNARKVWAVLHTLAILSGAAVVIIAGKPASKIPAAVLSSGVILSLVFAMSVEVFLFSLFISRRTKKGKFPYTLINFSFTVTSFPIFAIGCFTLSFIGYLLSFAVPAPKKWKQEILHFFIRLFSGFILRIYYTRTLVNPHGEDFSKPAVIVANHQSFLDILTVLSLNRKFIMVTSRWVWRSPFFGRVVRKAQFYPVEKGIENGLSHFRKAVDEGFSIVVFAEGSRQSDCVIKRFHKGAFYLAEKLSLDIVPLLIHGNGLCMTKGDDFYVKNGRLTMKILKRITPGNTQFGSTYQERTRKMEKFFKSEYDEFERECGTPDNRYFPDKLIKNYLYKGPILEWYLRVKLRMEKNYAPFHKLVPYEADVVDMGCGYGFMSYMLAFLSPKRRITGIDYDAEKIHVAQHCMAKNDRVQFMHADASTCAIPHADVFILSDMLHYLPVEKQRVIIERCAAKVKTGGMIIIRDGDASLSDKHRLTRLSEFFSTRFGFNKTKGGLSFTSRDVMRKILKSCGFEVTISRNDEHTSNVIYIARRERA